jgi:hypothetical protein
LPCPRPAPPCHRTTQGLFDDVERKAAPDASKLRPRAFELSQEKAGRGLADEYEEEFRKSAMGISTAAHKSTGARVEISALVTRLFGQLDALSNFHYTARPKAPEVEIRPNLPALQLEEAMPAATSLAQGLTPAEIKAPQHKRNIPVRIARHSPRLHPRACLDSIPAAGRVHKPCACSLGPVAHAPWAHPSINLLALHGRRRASSWVATSARPSATLSSTGTRARSAGACAKT